MQSKILLKCSLSIVGIAGIAFSAMFMFFPSLDLARQTINTEPVASFDIQVSKNLTDAKAVGSMQKIIHPEEMELSDSEACCGLPVRLKIPKINIDAVLEHVGLTPSGAMDMPKGYDNAAWFNLGPRPGKNGSAVIDGHYGRINGKASVFDNLYKLRIGDKIFVEDEKGATTVFVVRESRTYVPNADASDVFISNDGNAHLNLITCEGSWDKVSKSYSKRLVVFADKK